MPSTGPYGARNIWSSGSGSGSLSNGFTSRAATRENSASRDGQPSLSVSKAGEVEGKTGSGSLVDSSVSDDWNRPSYNSKRTFTTGRSIPQSRHSQSNIPQQRAFSSAGLSQSRSGANDTSLSFSNPPAPVNLNTTSQASSRPTFGSAFGSTLSSRISEQPPPVYTKMERPENSARKPDSAIGYNVSPTDTRRPSLQQHSYSNSNNMSHFRERSEPPSRQLFDQSIFSNPSYSHSTSQNTPSSSRAPSTSSRNGVYSSHSSSGADTLTAQFGQLRMHGNQRSVTAFRPANGFSSHEAFGNSTTNGNSLSFDAIDGVDDVEEVDRMQYLGLDGLSPVQASAARGYGGVDYGGRYLQTPTMANARNGFTMSNGNLQQSRVADIGNGPRMPSEWAPFASGMMPRRSPGLPEAQPFLDPRLHPVLAAQLRSPYAGQMYNPYALASAMPNGLISPYMSMLPMALNGVDAMPEASVVEGVQSALLFEFKTNNKSRRWELKEIYGHITEFAGDQLGSRFIQEKLKDANSDMKETVFREVEINASALMTDVFGNYVIQRFFEYGEATQKTILARKMSGQVLHLSLQMYGCRVVQKALDYVYVEQKAQIVHELRGNVLKCVKDQNGNHVIQKAIEKCEARTIAFIIEDFRGQVQQLAIHSYGCRVIQRCIERRDTPHKSMILAELMDGFPQLISDSFGNYVVQHVVQHDDGAAHQRVLQTVLRGLEMYSKHKFASNVVEKCLEFADAGWRRQVVLFLADTNNSGGLRADGEIVLAGMIKDQYANYVVQKLIDTLGDEEYAPFGLLLGPAMAAAKRTGCGKQVGMIEKKMCNRGLEMRKGSGVGGFGRQGFGSGYGSVAGTPPPLTADTRSAISSGLPSLNGDAVEGAAVGRKGSEPNSHDGFGSLQR